MTRLSGRQVNYVPCVRFITSKNEVALCRPQDWKLINESYSIDHQGYLQRNWLDEQISKNIIRLTFMKRLNRAKPSPAIDAKAEVLRQQGALHPDPDAVQDGAFHQSEFFDARDLVQVRYEMLRRHQVEGETVTEVATAFGVSRQAYYMTEAAFEQQGITGLLPRRRGPRRAHKCTDEILDFVERAACRGFP